MSIVWPLRKPPSARSRRRRALLVHARSAPAGIGKTAAFGDTVMPQSVSPLRTKVGGERQIGASARKRILGVSASSQVIIRQHGQERRTRDDDLAQIFLARSRTDTLSL